MAKRKYPKQIRIFDNNVSMLECERREYNLSKKTDYSFASFCNMLMLKGLESIKESNNVKQ